MTSQVAAVGDMIQVVSVNSGSVGYSWTTVVDPAYLTQVSTKNTPGGMPGAPTTTTTVYRAVKPGTTDITSSLYYRSSTPSQTSKVLLVINPATAPAPTPATTGFVPPPVVAAAPPTSGGNQDDINNFIHGAGKTPDRYPQLH